MAFENSIHIYNNKVHNIIRILGRYHTGVYTMSIFMDANISHWKNSIKSDFILIKLIN